MIKSCKINISDKRDMYTVILIKKMKRQTEKWESVEVSSAI